MPSKPPIRGIYFVQAETRKGLIKIGWSIDCRARLAYLQTGSQVKLVVLAICPATKRREQSTHRAFAHLRRHGEWFKPGPDLLTCIAQVRQAYPLPV